MLSLHRPRPQHDEPTVRELEARIDRIEADLQAMTDDRRWIVQVLADLAVDYSLAVTTS